MFLSYFAEFTEPWKRQMLHRTFWYWMRLKDQRVGKDLRWRCVTIPLCFEPLSFSVWLELPTLCFVEPRQSGINNHDNALQLVQTCAKPLVIMNDYDIMIKLYLQKKPVLRKSRKSLFGVVSAVVTPLRQTPVRPEWLA